MSSAVLEGGLSDDIHEIMYSSCKSSDMEYVEVQGVLFADSQEWHFQAVKRSD